MARKQDAEPPPPDFAAWIEEHLGFHAEAPGAGAWHKLLEQRLNQTHQKSFEGYKNSFAATSARSEEIAQLARVLTIGETYFFRDSRQYEAMMTVVLPELLRARPAHEKVRVLSAACSTGEEPYSIAMAARELLGPAASRVEIVAFDVNPEAIKTAQRGVYSEWALRATPSGVRRRYFTRQGNHNLLAESIRQAVKFERRNFFEDDPTFWRPGSFDLIWCRNVLIYFSPRQISTVLARLKHALAEDGALFLGNAETPRGYLDELQPREVCGAFCYVPSKDSVGSVDSTQALGMFRASVFPQPPVARPVDQAPSAAPTEPPANAGQNEAWVVAIDAATQRLSALVGAHAVQESSEDSQSDKGELGGAKREPVHVDLGEARRLIALERFAEALDELDKAVSAGLRDATVDLLRASVLTNQGRFMEARDICSRLLADYPHTAGAYHLLGVAAEQEGNIDEARKQHEMAILIDPKLAMSFWLLGRLCLRQARREQARRYLKEALRLFGPEIARDDAVQYSAGFSRETLEKLCRADLERCEVRR